MSIRLPGIRGEIPQRIKLMRMSTLRGADVSFCFCFLWSWPLCLSTGAVLTEGVCKCAKVAYRLCLPKSAETNGIGGGNGGG